MGSQSLARFQGRIFVYKELDAPAALARSSMKLSRSVFNAPIHISIDLRVFRPRQHLSMILAAPLRMLHASCAALRLLEVMDRLSDAFSDCLWLRQRGRNSPILRTHSIRRLLTVQVNVYIRGVLVSASSSPCLRLSACRVETYSWKDESRADSHSRSGAYCKGVRVRRGSPRPRQTRSNRPLVCRRSCQVDARGEPTSRPVADGLGRTSRAAMEEAGGT